MAVAKRNFPRNNLSALPGIHPDAGEAHDLRELLEPAIVDCAMGPFATLQRLTLAQAIDSLLECELHLAPQVYRQAHMALYRLAPVPRLVTLAEIELHAAEPVLLHYLAGPAQRRIVVEDFHALVDALANGSGSQAVQVLRTHLSRLKRAWSID
jgi:DNA-binding GntR family transcriptional regulator